MLRPHFPVSLSATDAKRGTPIRFQLIVGVVIVIVVGFTDVQVLGDMINVGTLSAFALMSFGAPILRKTWPDLERPFTVPLSAVDLGARRAAPPTPSLTWSRP
jgi:APA family basic amino acid/polyamine antiporter